MLSELNKVIISTGNILNVNKKAGQKTAEELFDCLKVTINDPIVYKKTGKIFRNIDDLQAKMTEFKREEIKIGAKIFINQHTSIEQLEIAIDNLLLTLGVQCLDNLILAYHPKQQQIVQNGSGGGGGGGHADDINGSNEPAIQNGLNEVAGGGGKEGVLEWAVGNVMALEDLKKLWDILEEYQQQRKICQLGIADLDTKSLSELYSSATVKPTIAQINLSACCVVPPSLQEFCTNNDIQLLTHSDPEEIITKSTLNDLNLSKFTTLWTTRYQVHIKCRGVLTAKGYIVCAGKN